MIEKLILNTIGMSVFVSLMCFTWKATARRWTRLARVYRAPRNILIAESSPSQQQTMQSLILVGGNIAWNSYKGIVKVSVKDEGIELRLFPPFSIFHPPLFIPFRDIQIQPKKWYLVGKTFQMSLTSVKDVQLILHSELVEWVDSKHPGLDWLGRDDSHGQESVQDPTVMSPSGAPAHTLFAVTSETDIAGQRN